MRAHALGGSFLPWSERLVKHPMQVLSIDPGLRNLALAVVSVKPGWTWSPACEVLAHPKETVAEFRHRALVEFLATGWVLDHLEVVDVSKSLGRVVTDIKRMPLQDKVIALCNTFTRLDAEWFAGRKPDVLVAEIQHNTNAEMKAVCMSSLLYFYYTMPGVKLCAITGVHKLKVCDALGIPEGAGLASKRPRKGAAPTRKASQAAKDNGTDTESEDEDESEEGEDGDGGPEDMKKRGFRKVGDKWIRTKQGSLDKYEDNKGRSKLALKRLLPDFRTPKGVKRDDVADALLQGLWILWQEIQPPKPKSSAKPAAGMPAAQPATKTTAARAPKHSLHADGDPHPHSDPDPDPVVCLPKSAPKPKPKTDPAPSAVLAKRPRKDLDEVGPVQRKKRRDAAEKAAAPPPPPPRPRKRMKKSEKVCFIDLSM